MSEEHSQLLPGVEEFLRKLGVNSVDSDFNELRKQVARALTMPSQTRRPVVPNRWEDPLIESIVKAGDRVLDLGCGDGDLLVRLVYRCGASVQGVDRNKDAVVRCIERGVPVCHEDLARTLRILPDKSFDFAVMEKTLQTLEHPLETLEDMLRVARTGVVSFPNFAHWSIRLAFSLGGRMPVTESLPYTWYNTPNIHLCSINDFLDWTRAKHVAIIKAWVLVEGEIVPFKADEHNITAEQALFVVRREEQE